MLVDSHCHLDRLDLDALGLDLATALDQARAAGVGHFLCISVDLESWPAMVEMVAPFDDVAVSVGVHPSHDPAFVLDEDHLVGLADHPRVVAIGETGLDYYYNQGDTQWQRQRFRTQVRAARRCRLPVIVHTRDARADTMEILAQEGGGEVAGVLHCFTESWEMARQALDLGFYISLSGIVTFRNAGELREVARQVPTDRLLVETDSPWLTPVPYRGKPNHPARVREVAQCVAEQRGVSLEQLAASTTDNYFRLFGRPRS